MTVMDIKPASSLTPEQMQLACAIKRTTESSLKLLEGDSPFAVMSQHLDTVETMSRFLGLTGAAAVEFASLAEVPMPARLPVDFVA